MLLTLCVVGVFAVFPYVLTVQKEILEKMHIPLPVFFLVQLVQSTVLFGIAIFLGLLLAPKVGFSYPILEALVSGRKVSKLFQSLLPLALLSGALSAVLIIVLDYFFMSSGITLGQVSAKIPLWERLLVPLYGGVNEEILLRLFLMTLFVWLTAKVKHTTKGAPTNAGIWISLVVSTVLFGLGHLPITASVTALTPFVIFRAILLNGIGGMVFGWLYWKKGLEAGMIAHFTADVVIHVIFPSLLLI